jgi:hypothetical protein
MATAALPFVGMDAGTSLTNVETMATWVFWNSNSIVATGTSISNSVWSYWNIGTASGVTSQVTASAVWGNWNQQIIVNSIGQANFQMPLETEEQRVAREARAKQYEEETKAKEIRAQQLLLSFLTEEQAETWQKEKRFEVVVKGKIYRIKKHERVHLLDEKKKPTIAYCIHPSSEHGLPAEDVALSQKLLLETDEEAFLRIANATRVA